MNSVKKDKILKRVDYKNDKKNVLVFEYEDGFKEEYKIFDSKDDGLRYIEVYNRRYPLVEKDDDYRDLTYKNYNFKRHIFLIHTDFVTTVFSERTYFTDAIFTNSVNFTRAEFNQGAYFTGAVFQGQVHFTGAKFHKQSDFTKTVFNNEVYFDKVHFNCLLYFDDAIFKKTAIFIETTFLEAVYFRRTKLNDVVQFHFSIFTTSFFSEINFNKPVSFIGSTFKQGTIFREIKFIKEVDFSNVTFLGKVDFSDIKFSQKANFLGVTFSRKVIFVGLTLANAEVNFELAALNEQFILRVNTDKSSKEDNKIMMRNVAISSKNLFINTNILKVLSRDTPHQTFTYFKDAALARHSTIDALEFHKWEYEALLREKNEFNIDYILLSVEKTVSHFGTNPLLAIKWWVYALLFFGLLILNVYILTLGHTSKDIIRYAFQPLSILQNYKIINEFKHWYILDILNFLKTITLAFLTYEITKSFRKFSRRF